MPFSTYAELQSAIADNMKRTNLTSKIPDFITLAEDDMAKRLRVWRQESLETLTTTAGQDTVALPSGTVKVKRARLTGNRVRPLLRVAADSIIDRYGNANANSPREYAFQTSNLLLGPTPDDAYTIEALCLINATPLSAGSPVNSILTNYPNCYLYGALMHGFHYIRHPEQHDLAATKFGAAIDAANMESIRRNMGGTPGPVYSFRRRIP